jgi:hypothetical protein
MNMQATTILALALLFPGVASAAELSLGADSALYAQNAGYDINIGVSATTSATVTAPAAAVPTEAELELEFDQIRSENPSVANIEAEERSITVAYLYPGKLFGFIPVAVRAESEAKIESGGEVVVKTHMPWWNLFVTGTGDVSARVDDELKANQDIVADVRMSGNVDARERVVDTLLSAHVLVAGEIE